MNFSPNTYQFLIHYYLQLDTIAQSFNIRSNNFQNKIFFKRNLFKFKLENFKILKNYIKIHKTLNLNSSLIIQEFTFYTQKKFKFKI